MKKILFLSWKDIRHPEVGGAEVVLWNYIKRLKDKGYDITWVGSGFEGGSETDNIEGVDIIRIGNINTVYFSFPKYYKKHLQGRYDIIVDEAGGMPLFSPLYEKEIPIVFLIHHIGDKEWDFKYPFPLNKIGKFLFKRVISLYRNCYTITVSNSTKEELFSLGFSKKRVFDIENALDISINHSVDIFNKKNELLFFGRIMPMKRAEHAILAFDTFRKKWLENGQKGDYFLKVIGPYQNGKYLSSLQSLVIQLGLEEHVIFTGGISLEERSRIASHKLLLFPSYKEGYGLVVLEGNVYGVPAIGYDVGGVRDSIKQGINGFCVEAHNYKRLGEKVYQVLQDEEGYRKLVESSYEHVKNHNSWDENAKRFEEILLDAHKKVS